MYDTVSKPSFFFQDGQLKDFLRFFTKGEDFGFVFLAETNDIILFFLWNVNGEILRNDLSGFVGARRRQGERPSASAH